MVRHHWFHPVVVADPYRYEPVLHGDRRVGLVTSGGYGHTVQSSLALAHLPVDCAYEGTPLTVQVLGRPCPATVVARPVFDSGNTRLAISR